ncbi:LLM class flavin-dependent oxidoreductase [Halobacteriales archaeon Cl-PHB]
MQFGVRVHEGGTSFEATARQAELAESVGFDSLWLGEHHGWPDDFWPSPQVPLAALAERTDTLRLGTCLSILPVTDPVRLAAETNLLDIVSDGRATLGVGVGWRPAEFDALGVDFADRGPRTTEHLRALRTLWGSDPATFDGEFVSFEDVQLSPPSVQQPRPPVWVGGLGDPTLQRAARLGDAWLPAWMPSVDTLRERLDAYHEYCREAGGDPADREQPLLRLAWVADDAATARRELQSVLEGIVAAYENVVGTSPLSETAEAQFRDDFAAYARDRVVVGTPADCAREIARYRDDLGVDHLLLKLANPGMAADAATDQIRRFGSDVLPRLE